MHPELIEWTCNRTKNEFRLLEPEAIAVWWGYHKNKVNVNYEKFSRSLRYYYDKGILRKIPGERYVYRFCIDPELMYRHIGRSDCRPQIKPMPEDARQAISNFQGKQNLDLSSGNFLIGTPTPEPLVAPRPISRSHSDSLPRRQLQSCRPIERCSSFDDTVYSSNPSEELSYTSSSVYVPDSSEASHELLQYEVSPAVSCAHSACGNFSTSTSGDFIQSHTVGGYTDFNASYNYSSPIPTMSETFIIPSTSACSFIDETCLSASQLLTCTVWE